MPGLPDLSLAEWTVLAVLDEGDAHGFAVAAQTAADGPLGRIWQIPRPIVYRALGRLEAAALVAPVGNEPGRGPRRQILSATTAGRKAVRAWLQLPVEHVRDVRSHLLMKLALLDRRGADPAPLLARQRKLLTPIVAALIDATSEREGFDATLAAWRRSSAQAALAFIDEITR